MAEKVEALMAYLYQNGQLRVPLGDGDFKALLAKLTERKRETRIRRV